MLKIAYSLGVRKALSDAGFTKEAEVPLWLKRALSGAGVGVGLGGGFEALMGNDISDVATGAGVGALGGALGGASLAALRRMKLNELLQAKREAMQALKDELKGIL